jgi:phosphatidate cytidylyltransferase
MSNLQLRIVSAIVLVAAVMVPTWFGGLAFRILAAAIAGAMFYEWATIARIRANTAHCVLLAALLAIVLVAIVARIDVTITLLLVAAAVVMAAVAGTLLDHGWSGTVGLAYAVASGLSLAAVRGDDLSGLAAILFLFAVVWATDILAYFTGRALGGPKLAPSISPGKTWSGAIGGAVGGVAAGLAMAASLAQPVGYGLVIVALVLSIVAQIGDLFESGAKRRFGVKDSSNIIPGHGGVMDRVDGLVAAAFALYVIGWALAGPDNPAHGLFPV